MLLIRRLWLVPAFLLTALFYYLFIYTREDAGPYQYPANGPDGLLHWTKRPEKYAPPKYLVPPAGPVEPIPSIQYNFESHPESPESRKLRESRRDAVENAFLHAWNGYKKYAWGKDEVAPVSGASRSSFGGWGATLVDAMDTLWIMGLKDEFESCVAAVEKIDFTTNNEETLNVFETTIRYLGGLLAAYDLSAGQYGVLLDKAKELGEILYTAFDTPTRMPVTRWQWRKSALGAEVEPGPSTLLAELGSLSLEFTRLAQLTGEVKYFDAIQRISNVMYQAQNHTYIAGLWPTIVDAKDVKFGYNHFTLSAMADSTYEYLAKEYLMLGGRREEYRIMYETAVDAAKKYLFFKPMVPKGEDILFSGNTALGDTNSAVLEPQGQHLACFIGGMLGIGAKIFNRGDDLAIARRLTDGCVWAYNAMPSGLMPETFHLVPCHVGTVEIEPGRCEWDDDRWYEAIASRHPLTPGTEKMSAIERGKYLARVNSIFPGFTAHGDNRYILRPEAIESLFILYRITGDPQLQDVAWGMFQSIDKATKTGIAHAALYDVRSSTPQQSDRMESFWLAETLKYFYLIFSEPTLVNLDEWVLNTEAHPLKRPLS